MRGIKGGYEKVYLFINRAFNIFLSLLLLIVGFPVFLILAIIVKLQDGGPIIYKQVRLGFEKKEFTMYKFRSLIPNAEQVIAGNPIERIIGRHELITPFGKLMRETRLDELPQLFNILKGDMDFIGPRPQRRAFYEKFCKHIKGYDKRFDVRPGLIGYSQLFIPHSSPRKIQALIDNKFLQVKQKFIWDTYFVILTMLTVISKTLYLGMRFIWDDIVRKKVFRIYEEKRAYDRIKHAGAKIFTGPDIPDINSVTDKDLVSAVYNNEIAFRESAAVEDINDEAVLAITDLNINEKIFAMKLAVEHRSYFWRKKKVKCAYCLGQVYKKIIFSDSTIKYVIKYRPLSPLNYYMIHQYFLYESLIE